jgi:hypothetical protein
MNAQRISRNLFLGAAGLSFLLSVSLWFVAGSRDQAIFVGLWVPSILALGNLYGPQQRRP